MIPRRLALSIAVCAAVLAAGCTGRRAVQERESAPDRTEVVAAPGCQDVSFPIYFETGSTQLTAAALESVETYAAEVKRCTVREVLVLGLADREGSADRNFELSRGRAETVAAALAAQGFPVPSFDIEAGGEAGAVTPANPPEPLRRRAEVVVRLGPPAVASPSS